jgi:hypothetical protein
MRNDEPERFTFFEVAGNPRPSPKCVIVAVHRTATLSPSATRFVHGYVDVGEGVTKCLAQLRKIRRTAYNGIRIGESVGSPGRMKHLCDCRNSPLVPNLFKPPSHKVLVFF